MGAAVRIDIRFPYSSTVSIRRQIVDGDRGDSSRSASCAGRSPFREEVYPVKSVQESLFQPFCQVALRPLDFH